MISITLENGDRVEEYLRVYRNKTKSKVQNVVKKSTYRITKGAKNNITQNGSVITGRLRSSITSKVENMGGISGTNVNYAKSIEEGSKPYIIRARNKKALYWPGANHPVKQVRHPGTQAKPYLTPVYEEELPKYMKDLKDAIKPE